jgi:hypothetical protein
MVFGSSVVFDNVSFSGNFGGETLPVICSNCGPVLVTIPFSGMDSLMLSRTQFACPTCRRKVYVQNASYEFKRKVIDKLSDAQLSRQQARRFARKVNKTKDLDNLEFESQFINPHLAEITRLAKNEKDPISAIKTAAEIAIFLVTMMGGVYTADELWDKYHKGELFERHAPIQPSSEDSDGVENDTENETQGKTEGRNSEPPRSWGGIDV